MRTYKFSYTYVYVCIYIKVNAKMNHLTDVYYDRDLLFYVLLILLYYKQFVQWSLTC